MSDGCQRVINRDSGQCGKPTVPKSDLLLGCPFCGKTVRVPKDDEAFRYCEEHSPTRGPTFSCTFCKEPVEVVLKARGSENQG